MVRSGRTVLSTTRHSRDGTGACVLATDYFDKGPGQSDIAPAHPCLCGAKIRTAADEAGVDHAGTGRNSSRRTDTA